MTSLIHTHSPSASQVYLGVLSQLFLKLHKDQEEQNTKESIGL